MGKVLSQQGQAACPTWARFLLYFSYKFRRMWYVQIPSDFQIEYIFLATWWRWKLIQIEPDYYFTVTYSSTWFLFSTFALGYLIITFRKSRIEMNKVLSFVKKWTLLCAMLVGSVLYLLFSDVPLLQPMGDVMGPALVEMVPYVIFAQIGRASCRERV